MERGARDTDVSRYENYNFECTKKTLGKNTIDQWSEGKLPSQDELDSM